MGKKKITEREAAGAFVVSILQSAKQVWPSVEEQLSTKIGKEDAFLNDPEWGSFEIGIASLAVESQAIRNLLPENQANRIMAMVLRCIDSPDLKGIGKDLFEQYSKAWKAAIEIGDMPFYDVASILYDHLEIPITAKLFGSTFKSPTVIMMLSEKIMDIGGKWWKKFLEDHILSE